MNEMDLVKKAQAGELSLSELPDDFGKPKYDEPSDVSIQRLVLTQSDSPCVKENLVPVGRYAENDGSRDYGEVIEFVPIAYYKQRMFFLKGGSGSYECFAMDAKTGSKHGECFDCQFKEFETADGQKKEGGPECNVVYGYLGFVVKDDAIMHEVPLMLGMKSTATKAARYINGIYQKTGARLFERKWRLSSERTRQGSFDFFKLKAKMSGKPSEELIKKLLIRALESANVQMEIIPEGEKAGSEDDIPF